MLNVHAYEPQSHQTKHERRRPKCPCPFRTERSRLPSFTYTSNTERAEQATATTTAISELLALALPLTHSFTFSVELKQTNNTNNTPRDATAAKLYCYAVVHICMLACLHSMLTCHNMQRNVSILYDYDEERIELRKARARVLLVHGQLVHLYNTMQCNTHHILYKSE